MTISQLDFAAMVRNLRPKLVQVVRRLLRCSYDEAEDVVSEVVVIALARLDDYDKATGIDGLRYWLITIVLRTAHYHARAETRREAMDSLAAARTVQTSELSTSERDFKDAIRSLRPDQGLLVMDWMDGYSQDDIARRLRIHRNTVAIRLEEAFDRMRIEFPDIESLEYSVALFAACSRVTVYRKPTASWLPWEEQHPPEAPFRRKPSRQV